LRALRTEPDPLSYVDCPPDALLGLRLCRVTIGRLTLMPENALNLSVREQYRLLCQVVGRVISGGNLLAVVEAEVRVAKAKPVLRKIYFPVRGDESTDLAGYERWMLFASGDGRAALRRASAAQLRGQGTINFRPCCVQCRAVCLAAHSSPIGWQVQIVPRGGRF
jgi:hypothetical protein